MSTLTIDLNEEQAARQRELESRTGLAADAVMREALDLFASALYESPPYSAEQVAAIEEGLAAAERGDLVPQEEIFEELRKKFG